MLDAISYGERVIGPIMYEYVSWILHEALDKKIETLYFLARDGYLLKQIAEKICEKKGYHIQCKYLYCSRMALRMPTYHFIGDEAYDLLLQGGYHITPFTLMRRLALEQEERQQVYKEIGVFQEERALTTEQFQELTQKIRNSQSFRELMYCKSTASYYNVIGYFKQEGLFDNSQIAIVDSGWSGSMQRSLRQLLEREGYKGRIIGFYFGLYNVLKEKGDGEYLAYYFDALHNMKHKIYFDNTLFECMLSAPHGMTTGFSYDGKEFQPILKSNINVNLLNTIQSHIEGAIIYTESTIKKDCECEFIRKKSVKRTYKTLKRAVLYPTRDEIEVFCDFNFCDDVSEDYFNSLVQKDMFPKLKNYMFIPKIIAKLSHKDNIPIDDVFWPYGVITYVKYPMRLWYRWNIIMLQTLRYIRLIIKRPY